MFSELPCVNVKFLVWNLLGEIIPVVTEKYEFDYRDKSKNLNFLEISHYRDYDGRIKNVGFLNQLNLQNYRAFD